MITIRPQDKKTFDLPLKVPDSIYQRLNKYSAILNDSDREYVVLQLLDQALPQLDAKGNIVPVKPKGRRSSAKSSPASA